MMFIEGHPGRKFVRLIKCKNYVIPQICSPPNSFCDMRELQRDKYNVSDEIKDLREAYALNALILFVPFRSLEDFQDTPSKLYWDKLIFLLDNNKILPKGLEILQNIQERKNLDNLPKMPDYITERTVLKEPTIVDKTTTKETCL